MSVLYQLFFCRIIRWLIILANYFSVSMQRFFIFFFFILFSIFSFFFFFSSRRRHTRWTGDWSSDVCSSDLLATDPEGELAELAELYVERGLTPELARQVAEQLHAGDRTLEAHAEVELGRSEERRVGKECRSRWSAYH